MKCKICKQKTHWDESYGMLEFIVCPRCFEDMAEAQPERDFYEKRNKVLSMILAIGKQIEKVNNTNRSADQSALLLFIFN